MEQSNWTVKEDSSFISSLLSHSMSHISKYILLDATYGLAIASEFLEKDTYLFCSFTPHQYNHFLYDMLIQNVNGLLCRTIMALWKARSLTPEQKVQLVEEESETEDFQNEEGGSFLGIEDAKMTAVFSSTKPFDVRFLILHLIHIVQSTMCSIKSQRVYFTL